MVNGTVYNPAPDIVEQLKDELPALGKLFIPLLTLPKAEAQIAAGRGYYAILYKQVSEWVPKVGGTVNG